MSDEKEIREKCAVCGDSIAVVETLNWDSYMADFSLYNTKIIGYRCDQCGAVFCFDKHKKEMKVDLLKGFRRTGTCTVCGSLMKNCEVLIGEQTRVVTNPVKEVEATGTNTGTARWLGAGYLFQEKHEKDLAKYTKRKKFFLIWAGLSTLSMFVFAIIIAIFAAIFSEVPDTVMSVIMPIMVICGLGTYSWPFFFFHLIKKKKVEKLLEKLPPQGKERFTYVAQTYSEKRWEKLYKFHSEPGKTKFQKKKRFNILIALFWILFGLFGFFWYLWELGQPGEIIELELTEEGCVLVTVVPH